MSSQNKGIMKSVVFCLAFIALIMGASLFQHLYTKSINPDTFHGTYLKQARVVAPFNLTGADEQPFTIDSLKGQWTMVFFGFTHCGYVCPTTMAELGKMYKMLEQKKVKILPQVVMISIDPKRDSIALLKTYVRSFNEHFFAARGDSDSILALTKELGIVYTKVALKDSDKNYDMQHSGAVMLFNPQGRLNAFFTGPQNADWLVEDYLQLVS